MGTQFRKDLAELLNRYSKENGSDTPDFILARYLENVLENFDAAVKEREEWYGREPHIADLPEDYQQQIPFPDEIPPVFLDNQEPFIDYDSTGTPPPSITDIRRTGDKPDEYPSTTSGSE